MRCSVTGNLPNEDFTFCVNGVFDVANQAAAATVVSDTNVLTFGAWEGGGSQNLDGNIYFAAAWGRLFSRTEQLSLNNNPYQILRPKLGGL